MSSSENHRLEPVTWIAREMSAFSGWWALCGGWAVDAWLGGQQRRDHVDIDITVAHRDLFALRAALPDWHFVAHDIHTKPGESHHLWDGRPLDMPAHIHARAGGQENLDLLMPWVTPPHQQVPDDRNLDFIFNHVEGSVLVLDADPRVSLPLGHATQLWSGIPTFAPEVLMYLKATAYRGQEGYPRPHDRSDFLDLMPILGEDQRTWLRDSIATVTPTHPWLADIPQ